jgi:hypothetical protein
VQSLLAAHRFRPLHRPGAERSLHGVHAAAPHPGLLRGVIPCTTAHSADPQGSQQCLSPLLASPWNVIGQGLPPSAALSAARGVVYLGGADLTGPLAVLAMYAAAGTLLTLAATAWRRHRAGSRAPQPAEPLPPTKEAMTCATAP